MNTIFKAIMTENQKFKVNVHFQMNFVLENIQIFSDQIHLIWPQITCSVCG